MKALKFYKNPDHKTWKFYLIILSTAGVLVSILAYFDGENTQKDMEKDLLGIWYGERNIHTDTLSFPSNIKMITKGTTEIFPNKTFTSNSLLTFKLVDEITIELKYVLIESGRWEYFDDRIYFVAEKNHNYPIGRTVKDKNFGDISNIINKIFPKKHLDTNETTGRTSEIKIVSIDKDKLSIEYRNLQNQWTFLELTRQQNPFPAGELMLKFSSISNL